MTSSNRYDPSPPDIVRLLRDHPRRWVLPAAAMTAVALIYAVVRPATWEVSQALVVREEAASGVRSGKFVQPEDMKTTQETIMELAKSRSVVGAALTEIGPPTDDSTAASWPNEEDISEAQSAVKLTPPKGAEFGKTEVFYLKVQQPERSRAVALAEAISHQLQRKSQQLRDRRADSLVAELTKSVTMAKRQLDDATVTLTGIERTAGADLGELRILQESPSGDSPLRRSTTEMENELRQSEAAIQANDELMDLLMSSHEDPQFLAAAPNRLLESQPALRKLKDGMLEAQLKAAQLLGTMSDAHPQVVAARTSQQEVGEHVRRELDVAIRGLEMERQLAADRAAVLQRQLAEARQRLAVLAGIRAEYGNVVADARHRAEILKSAEQQLAEAQASKASAQTASLITPIDRPELADYPVGPSRSMIVLGGMVGGLAVGLGIVFLTVRPQIHLRVIEPPATTASAIEIGHASNGHNQPSVGNLSLKQALSRLIAARA